MYMYMYMYIMQNGHLQVHAEMYWGGVGVYIHESKKVTVQLKILVVIRIGS